MAHRKVLSAEAPTAWDSTCLSSCDSCPSYCGSSCCYVYSSPPPPVSPYLPPVPSRTPGSDRGGGSSALPPAVIVVIALLGGIFLLVSYYFIIAKSCLIRRRGRSRGRTPPDGGEGGGSWEEEFVEEGRVDHPIWYIRTVGLSPAAISAIAEYEYRKGEGLVEGSDCTVCLSEFSDGEALRILPKCGHAFHVPCIDAWLRSHTNCPLCRAAIVVPVQLPLPPPERLSQRLDGGGGGGGGDRAAGAVVGGGENSNGAGAGEGVEPGEPNGGGLPKEIEEVSGQNGQLGLVVMEEEEGVVPVRRSFSVDSPFLVIEFPGGSEPESSNANTSEARRIDESQSSADRAGTSSRPAGRSQSWSGRLFMPRPNSNSRNSSNSNLSR
ncbi:E3 ubiquitin-protein ligase Os04g0590900 [Eucalyptus grandis]|uniref:E3 ubiquitin-protein ligase Os04g0590900 n=1 Tax=Eucalyptus grandis TaxID=71139 RepID=UPI00192EA3ED|nr:E3 ubiquitin-protein ligase Os04g0590900 [Eucalyptus grandis]